MKNAPTNNAAESKQALIFIPDISGFTQFVTDTEISHSKHIIEELLEILIDANKIGLEISEIEGDAILFYRFGDAPKAEALLDQVKQMFSKFHLHLKKYESHRVCNCGACRTANNLTVKFVAHYGDITMNTIRQYKKLFGKEVIVAHRLLKNDIDHHEYSLFTDNLTSKSDSWEKMERVAWSEINRAEQDYDSGKVHYSYLSMDPILANLPEIPAEDYAIQGAKSKMIVTSVTVNAPIDMAFNVISDVTWRTKWIPGTADDVDEINSLITQSGQTHRCITNGPVIVGHDYHIDKKTITYTETDTKKTYCVVYTLQAISDTQTQLTGSMYLSKNPVKELMFRMLMKKKITKSFEGAWVNFKEYCEGLVARGEQHQYTITPMMENLEVTS
jgi:hypothetical protein